MLANVLSRSKSRTLRLCWPACTVPIGPPILILFVLAWPRLDWRVMVKSRAVETHESEVHSTLERRDVPLQAHARYLGRALLPFFTTGIRWESANTRACMKTAFALSFSQSCPTLTKL